MANEPKDSSRVVPPMPTTRPASPGVKPPLPIPSARPPLPPLPTNKSAPGPSATSNEEVIEILDLSEVEAVTNEVRMKDLLAAAASPSAVSAKARAEASSVSPSASAASLEEGHKDVLVRRDTESMSVADIFSQRMMAQERRRDTDQMQAVGGKGAEDSKENALESGIMDSVLEEIARLPSFAESEVEVTNIVEPDSGRATVDLMAVLQDRRQSAPAAEPRHLPPLWGGDQQARVQRRASASQTRLGSEPSLTSGLLRMRTGIEGELEKLFLPGLAVRISAELLAEVSHLDPTQQSAFLHLVATACRQSAVAEAGALARQLDTEAVELDPTLLLSHLWLVMGAWRESDWEDCAVSLGRMSTQLDEMAHVRKELTTQLPLLYTLLELMMEWRLKENPESLVALCHHALGIEGNRLVALLNFTRHALARRDEMDTYTGYQAVIASAPPIVAEAFAIDWMNQLWLERGDPRAALEFLQGLGDVEVRDPYHLACVQMLAWANHSASLEVVALRGWSSFDETAAYQPRSADEGGMLAARRAAFRHRCGLLYEQLEEVALRERELQDAIALDPLCLLYAYQWGQHARRSQQPLAMESALSAQTALVGSVARREILDFRRWTQCVDGESELTPIIEGLAQLELPAALVQRARLLRAKGEFREASRLEVQRWQPLAPFVAAAILEAEFEDFEAAAALYKSLVEQGSTDVLVTAGLQRCAKASGKDWGAGLALSQLSTRQKRELSWTRALETRSGEEAIEALGEYLKEEASDGYGWQLLIEHLAASGDHRRLDGSCQKLASLAGDDQFLARWSLEHRVMALMTQAPAAGIARALKDLGAAFPDSEMVWQGEYQQLVRVGKWPELVRHCEIQARRDAARRPWLQLRCAWMERTLLGNPARALELVSELSMDESAAPVVVQMNWMMLAESGDWERLAGAFERMLELCQPAPRATFLEHLASLKQDRLVDDEGAERLYREALAIEPNSAAAWRELVGLAWRKRNWEAVSVLLKERLELELSATTRCTHLRERAFVTAVLLNHMQAAEQSYSHLLQMDRDVFALRGLARLARSLGNNGALIRLLGEMVEEIDDPFDQLYALAEQGRCLQRVNGSVSTEWLASLAELVPGHPLFEFSFFTLFEEEVEPQRRLQLSELLIGSEHPVRAALDQLLLSRLLFGAGRAEEAYEKAHALWLENPDCLPALLGALAMAQSVRRHDDALRLFNELRDLYLPRLMPRFALLAALQHARECADAEACRALQSDLEGLEDLGELELDLAEPSQYLSLCEDLLSVQTSPLRRGFLLVTMARLQETIHGARGDASYALWLAAARLVPSSRELRQALMRYAIVDILSVEQRAELRRYLLGLLQADEYVEMWLQIANEHENRDDLDGAREALDTVLSCNPGERRALQRHAEMAWERGEIDVATSWLQKLAHITTHRGLRAAIELEIGLVLEALFERPLEAFDHYSRALEALPSDASLLYFGARALESLEEWGTAAQMRLQEASAHRHGSEYQAIVWATARIFGRRLGAYDVVRGLIDRNVHPTVPFDPRLLLVGHELASVYGDVDTLLLQRLLEVVECSAMSAALCWQTSEWSSDANEQVVWLERALEFDTAFVVAAYPLEFGAAEMVSPQALSLAYAAQGRAEQSLYLLSRAADCARSAGDIELANELTQEAFALSDATSLMLPWGPAAGLLRHHARTHEESSAKLLAELFERQLVETARLMLSYHLGQHSSAAVAAPSWRKVLEKRPNDNYAKQRLESLLGASRDRAGLIGQRRHELQRLRQSSHAGERAQLRTARWELSLLLASDSGGLDELRSLLDEQLAEAPTDTVFGHLRAHVERRAMQDESLLGQLRRLLPHVSEPERAALALEWALLAHLQLRRPQEALQAYAAVLEAEPSSLVALDARCQLFAELRDEEGVVQSLRELAQLEPDDGYRAVLFFELGMLTERSNFDEGRDFYQQALSLAPEMQAAQLAVERLLFMSGASEQSLELYALIGESAPSPIAAQYLAQYAVLCDELRRPELLVQLSPEGQHPALLLQQFRIAATTQSPEAVAEVCHAFAHWVKESSAARLLLEAAVAFASATDWAASDELLWHLHESEPANRGLLIQLGAGIDFTGERGQATSRLNALSLAAGSSREKALTALDQAVYLLCAGDFKNASVAVEEAAQHWPKFLPMVKFRRFVAEAEGDPARIAELAEEEANLGKDPSTVLRCLMQAASMRQVRLNDMAGAKRLFQRILEIEPLHDGAFISLDSLLATEQAYDAQRSLLRRRAELVSDEETRKRLLARAAQIAALSDNVDAAIEDYQQQLTVDPNDIPTYQKLAEISVRNERWELAISTLERLVQRGRDSAVLHVSYKQLGALLIDKLGSDSRALMAFRHAQKLDPDDLMVLHQLAALYERTQAYDECLDVLQRIVGLEIDFNKKKKALTKLCMGLLQWRGDHSAAEQRLLEMRQLDTQDLSLLEMVSEYFVSQNLEAYRDGLLLGAFGTLREQYLYDTSRADLLHPLQRLCKLLEWNDRAFVLSSMLVGERMANEVEIDFYEQCLGAQNASRVVKPAAHLLSMVTAPGLSRGLLELMCLTERALARVSPHNVHMKALAWRYKMRPSSRTELTILASFLGSFGIDEIPFYVLPERADTPLFIVGRETAFTLTEAELRHDQLPVTRFRVAAACAAVALGVAGFSALGFPEFHAMILALAKSCAPEVQVSQEIAAYAEAFSKVLPKKTREQFRPWMLQAIDSLTESHLVGEYQALQLTLFRQASLALVDPAGVVPALMQAEVDGTLPVRGATRDMQQFLLGEQYADCRKESGASIG